MDVKVLGAGCANCHRLEERVTAALGEIGEDPAVEMVTDFARIAAAMPLARHRQLSVPSSAASFSSTTALSSSKAMRAPSFMYCETSSPSAPLRCWNQT